MKKQQELGDVYERAGTVLNALVCEYVHKGKPVGSRRLAKIHGQGLSAATIRNVMADLEEMGFLAQPHTSAGRVPTAKGYRFHVGSLLQTKDLAIQEVSQIRQRLEEEKDPGELMHKASHVLSAFSSNVGFVLAPSVSLVSLKHIEFVKIARRRILVILVTGTGLVQHRLIHLDQKLTQGELNQAGRYLVTHFEGKTLREIRDELVRLMMKERSLYNRILQNVILLGSAGLMRSEDGEDDESEVYWGSTAGIVQKPELADINRLVVLLRTFEEKRRIVKIINQCLKTNPKGPTVTIGLEEHIPEMGDWALISSPYVGKQGISGSLGILGPSRMEYEKAISLVDYVAKLFGKLMSTN